jgi:NAD(P)-dependent dehydrogenase (short-subunit alcohol dehydrogenase family)
MSDRKLILITGAGSGFGRDAALIPATIGHDVLAVVHDEQQRTELADVVSARALPLRMEIRELLSESDRAAVLERDVDGCAWRRSGDLRVVDRGADHRPQQSEDLVHARERDAWSRQQTGTDRST